MFCVAVVGSLICQLMVIYFEPLQHVFQTEALTLFGEFFILLLNGYTCLDLVFLTLLTSTVFLFNEAKKYYELRLCGTKNGKEMEFIA